MNYNPSHPSPRLALESAQTPIRFSIASLLWLPQGLYLAFGLFASLLLFPKTVTATDFAQEAFLVPHGVAANGSALMAPPLIGAPMNFLDWPAGSQARGIASIEASTQPLFDGLSRAILGAGQYQYDGKTRLFAMTGIIGTDNIPVRPLLAGSHEERLNRPELRPDECQSCSTLRDQVYLGALNAQRAFQGEMPRSGISSQPIPLTLWTGLTTKYFWEELEGDGYTAQALNLDGGVALSIALSYDPVAHQSSRDLTLSISGFELLPTPQRSEIEGLVKDEIAQRRWHVGMQWRESWPKWNSTTAVGLLQRSEFGRWPGFAVEWDLNHAAYLRFGYDGFTLATGVSINWHWISVHYALQKQDLGTTWYQVSLQLDMQ